jgi:lipopolysaccharide biosynthesis protein
MNLLEQFIANTSPGLEYEDDNPSVSLPSNPLVKLIAFYLPQFHAIPENDAWWGKGFTEWTNTTKAIPRFVGHYQPRLPGELGFYNLTHAETLTRQSILARRYGIYGFCFHYYWFFGKRLLERPIDLLLSRPDIDLPFCINWANESWTRRWDGYESSILQKQEHSPEDDIAFAESVEPFMRDPRYIRIEGRPLLMLYRPGRLPDAAQTVARWRAHFIKVGLGDPYILMVQAFGDGVAAKYGMDAAVGFPPFWAGAPKLDNLELLDPKYSGDVVDYAAMAQATIAGYATDQRVFPGVCPSWDNEARKPGRGACFTGSTPERYGNWLHAACDAAIRAFPPAERLVFINAWNEWAEGAYLEPDRHFGYAYLSQTAKVVNELTESAPARISEKHSALPPMIAMTPKRSFQRRIRQFGRRGLNRLADIAEDISWRLRKIVASIT